MQASCRRSAHKLEPLEAVQGVLDLALALRPRALGEPGPFADEQLAALAVGLEIERGHDFVADKHRLCEVAEHAVLLRHISLEAMLVTEKSGEALALDHQR